MGEQFYCTGYQRESAYNSMKGKPHSTDKTNEKKEDKDLIIEENTIYEIDRECFERLKKQRRRRGQERKSI